MKYGVEQERDWNRMSDADFRAHIRADFKEHYPDELRFPPCRLRFAVLKDWYLRMKSRPSFRPILADHLPGEPPPRHYANLDF